MDCPISGRADEIVAAEAALAAGGVVLVGPAGVGRTRTAREILARARRAGRETEWLAATKECASIPFGAILPLLDPDEGANAAPGGDPLVLLSGAVRRTAARARRSPLVVGIDDAHLLDDGSAGVVHHLAVRGLVSVVATVRDGEQAPDGIVALWKDGLATRVRLNPLGPAAMTDILTHVLGSYIAEAHRREIARMVDGNPQMLAELLIGAHETVTRVRAGAAWLSESRDDAEGPTRVRPENDEALSELSPREREIVLLAAGGAASKDIAELLSLSVRTVDNHLGRAYAKLGVSGRAELAVLVAPRRHAVRT
ncbi:LuxR C-terminal-related transcriptional regulator [Actinomadura syzygii]|uniref:Helix-turn-helix transcriptional regulator n=1 Tax=Actinomadura syzygii TaxID=1427538 RepID=A0A5D0TNR5_9ACTN|nr:LuxR C-terminal-related transcriptional regulator [Actinomadura syzygii]TYC07504.1 helix-turn-helix transcriptional regulator [Actinomadura syzygii]